MMHAEFERVDEIVRVFVDRDTYGDPWVWIAAVRHDPPGRVFLVGVTELPTADVRQALFAACRERGWVQVGFKRRKEGKLVTKWISVPA